jgi:anti-sigma B factor antagonist
MNGLRIAHSTVGDHLVLALEGELSVLSSYAFSQTVDEQVRQNNALKVVLDVGELEFIDSNGLGTIAKLYEELRMLGGCLHLARIRANLMEMLYAAKLDKALSWHKTVEEAVAACDGAASVPAVVKTDPLGGPVEAPPAEEKPAAAASAPAEDESEFGMLPEHEGCANYPTWFVIHWLSTRDEVRAKAAALIGQTEGTDEAAVGLHKLVGQYAAAAVDRSTLNGRIVVSASTLEEVLEGVALKAVMDRYLPDFVVIGFRLDTLVFAGCKGELTVFPVDIGDLLGHLGLQLVPGEGVSESEEHGDRHLPILELYQSRGSIVFGG